MRKGRMASERERRVSDEETELLETYLDGALSPEDAQRVERRIEREAEWAAALGQLRAERTARRAAWESYEPQVAAADRVGLRAARRAVRADEARRVAVFARRASIVAAGLMLAFAGGWVARGRGISPSNGSTTARFQVALTDEGGNIIAVQHFSDPRQARQFAEDVGRWQSGARQDDVGDFSQVSSEF